MAADDDLLALAIAVSDGVPIDWDSAESSASSADMLDSIRNLRSIATLDGVRRTAVDTDDTIETPAFERRHDREVESSALPHWGHFALLERLGQGMQGEVFRAIDTRLDREVALKFLKPRSLTGDVDHLLSEARLLARIRHPNVVTVHGADLISGRVALWMELIDGDTLDGLITRNGLLSATEAVVVGVDVCRAVSAVHASGLLHRDIKAQNVMREKGGRYVLMDFGAGHDQVKETVDGHTAGTPLYLPPEVINGHAATPQSDLYAIGVLLFYLTTGTFPVVAGSVAGLARAHAAGTRRRLSDVRGNLSREFCDLVERAIDPDPARRFRSAAAMSDALRTVVAGGPVGPVRFRLLQFAAALAVVVGLVLSVLFVATRPTPLPERLTVAILPFQDLSTDQRSKFLAEGLADQLITDLGQRTDLTVIARTSSQQFAGSRAMLDMARDLGVNVIVEGSVRPEADRLNVSLRVLMAGSGVVVSSRTFSGERSAVGRMPGDLVQYVATALSPRGMKTRSARQIQMPPMDPVAAESYFRGWNEYWRLSRDGFREARRLFEDTVARAPDLAPAHAALSYVTFTLAMSYHDLPIEEAVAVALQEADRALALDPDGALPNATAGWIKFYAQWDWPGAEQRLRRAVELNPSDAQAHWMYAQLLLVQNRIDAALEEARLAQRLDPLNPARHSNVATALYYGRRYAEAAQESQLLLSRDPNSAIGHFGLARFLASMGRHDEAAVTIKTALNANEPPIRAELARILFAAGRESEATSYLPLIEADYRAGRLAPDYVAFVEIARGDRVKALRLLEEALSIHSSTVIWIGVDPRYDALRSDTDFVAILRAIGLAS